MYYNSFLFYLKQMYNLELIELLNWAYKLIGVKYVWVCNSEYMLINHIPMYGVFTKLPTIEFIKNSGCNCVGLINLLRLKNNKNIPGHNNKKIVISNSVGSLGLWIYELNKHKFLSKYDKNLSYEIGTLLIKPTNFNTYGHMAIIVGHNKILHSYTNDIVPNEMLSDESRLKTLLSETCRVKTQTPGLCITDINDFTFNYTCSPLTWLYHDF